ncbi:MAG: hypothetical protein ACJ8EL_16920 [Rhizomicrobium sp.]|jgi:hypothetical protein
MSITEHHHGAYTGAGLFVGGLAWTVSTVIGSAYADYSCALRLTITGMIAAGALFLTLVGGLLSWRSSRLLQAINLSPAMPARHARIFLAQVSMMAAAVFGLAILFQLAASGIFSGCER